MESYFFNATPYELFHYMELGFWHFGLSHLIVIACTVSILNFVLFIVKWILDTKRYKKDKKEREEEKNNGISG